MSKRRGLGKGLQALLPSTGEKEARLRELAINEIIPNQRQPRQVVNEEKLFELAESIKEHGIVQPILVRMLSEGKYELIAGERRWRACQLLGMEKITAVVREYGDLEAAAVALIENIQRENLNPLEEAKAYRVLMDEFGLTQEDVSQRVGKSRPFVGNMVRLLLLPEEIQDMVSGNQLTSGHARAILGLQDKERQIRAAQKIIDKQMNVRQAESLVKGISEKKPRVKKEKGDLTLMEKELSSILPAKVRLLRNINGGGRVILEFKKQEEMFDVLEKIKKGWGTRIL